MFLIDKTVPYVYRHGMRELVKDSVNTMNTKRGRGLSTFLKLTQQSLSVEVMTAL